MCIPIFIGNNFLNIDTKYEELFALKKFIAVLMICLLMAGMAATMATSVSAASPKERLIDVCKEQLPEPMLKRYLPSIENTLAQVSVSEEQADQVTACIIESREYFDSTGGYKGVSLSEYTVEQQRYAVAMVARICNILNLRYEIVPSSDPKHTQDVVFIFYNAAGQKLGEFDGDAVKKTDTPYDEPTTSPVNYGYVALAALLVVGAAAAVVVSKKLTADR